MSSNGPANHPVLIALSAAAAVATILGVLLQFQVISWPPWTTTTPTPSIRQCGEPSLSLSKGSGPSGTRITVKGSGFPSHESVELRFHTEEMLPERTDSSGQFSASVTIPGTFDFAAPFQFYIQALTSPSGCSGTTPFRLTK